MLVVLEGFLGSSIRSEFRVVISPGQALSLSGKAFPLQNLPWAENLLGVVAAGRYDAAYA